MAARRSIPADRVSVSSLRLANGTLRQRRTFDATAAISENSHRGSARANRPVHVGLPTQRRALADRTNLPLVAADACPVPEPSAPPAPANPLVAPTRRPDVWLIVESSMAPTEAAQVHDEESEYEEDIMGTYFLHESEGQPRADYMDMQPQIKPRMRSILVEWLAQVNIAFRFKGETLYLAINIMDRYLSKTAVEKTRFQLVGVAAMLIAAKFEEVARWVTDPDPRRLHPPPISRWVAITENAYTENDVNAMEHHMIMVVNFQVMVPTIAHFFPRLLKANGCNSFQSALVQYMLELSLLDVTMLKYKPSHVASAAVALSNALLSRRPVWPPSMEQESRYERSALQECGGVLWDLLSATSAGKLKQAEAIKKKFSQPKFHCVASLTFSICQEQHERVSVQRAEEYAADIIEKLFIQEGVFLPTYDLQDRQTAISSDMRAILVGCFVGLQMKHDLRVETLHLAVSLVDRYMFQTQVTRERFALVGIVAMHIAAKFEEIYPPSLDKLLAAVGGAHAQDDVIAMECSMLLAINFQVAVPTCAHFFPILQKMNDSGNDVRVHRELAQYILELAMLDAIMLQHLPSYVVAAAILLSNELLGHSPAWPAHMVQASRHTEPSLRSCVTALRALLEADHTRADASLELEGTSSDIHRCAVYWKFADPHHCSVALLRFSR